MARLYSSGISVALLITTAACLPVLSNQVSPEPTCGPADGFTILLFYLVNYGAHALTVFHKPGEKFGTNCFYSLLGLLLPFSGVFRACMSIAFGFLSPKNDLRRALNAGALCEVTRDDDGFTPNDRKIHGCIHLPPGYKFKVITEDIEFADVVNRSDNLSCTTSRLQSLIAIVQLVYSGVTLYHTRGNQIQIYGYAAYGLTVISYSVMSFVNLIANLVTPNYPALFMIRTPTMSAAEADPDHGVFDGVVADITNERRTGNRRTCSSPALALALILAVLAMITPYVLMGALTKFQSNSSTTVQRAWIMIWLVFGQLYGVGSVGVYMTNDLDEDVRFVLQMFGLLAWSDYAGFAATWLIGLTSRLPLFPKMIKYVVVWIELFDLMSRTKIIAKTSALAPGVAAIGGFVVVGQMLVVNGNCS
jgi:hypothetical protein